MQGEQGEDLDSMPVSQLERLVESVDTRCQDPNAFAGAVARVAGVAVNVAHAHPLFDLLRQ